jgi:hypothetical protein
VSHTKSLQGSGDFVSGSGGAEPNGVNERGDGFYSAIHIVTGAETSDCLSADVREESQVVI